MTMPTISLDVAKQHLRILPEDIDDDADITRKIDQASAIVSDYLKKADDWTPTAAETPILEAATLMVLSKLYDDRNVGEENDERVALGYLSPQVTAILHRLRDPAVA
jgi:Phage gp6-like head-tail connector protein